MVRHARDNSLTGFENSCDKSPNLMGWLHWRFAAIKHKQRERSNMDKRPCEFSKTKDKFLCHFKPCLFLSQDKGSAENYYTRTGPAKAQKRCWSLLALPFLNLKRWCLYRIATPLSSRKKWQWDSNLTFLVYVRTVAMLTFASWIVQCQLKL